MQKDLNSRPTEQWSIARPQEPPSPTKLEIKEDVFFPGILSRSQSPERARPTPTFELWRVEPRAREAEASPELLPGRQFRNRRESDAKQNKSGRRQVGKNRRKRRLDGRHSGR